MKRLLVVANETVAGKPLIDAVKRRADGDEVHVHVISPQNQPKHGYVVYDEHTRDAANNRLEITIALLREEGIEADGEVMDPDPYSAVMDALGEQDYDEIILSTHPELVLPVNRPVEFKIQTKDVIHSFWVPQFRLKSDAVPGLTTAIRVTPNRTGRYEVVCAELCGLGHSTMRQFVRVLPASDFDSWVSKQKKAASAGGGGTGGGGGGGSGGEEAAGANGEAIFTSAGCAGCHTLRAAGSTAKVGPNLGKLENADAAFIRKSIVDPSAEVEEGFQDGVMPQNFGKQLSKDELDALVKYLLESQE